MVSHADNADSLPPSPGVPKPLAGVGIVVQSEGRALGVIFARNVDDLKELLIAVHGSSITVNLADIRGGTITLDHPKKK